MNKVRVKICGVRTPELAYSAALAGAHFIGLVFHPHSKRHVTLGIAKEVALATKAGGAIPVAVFVEQAASEMQAICEATGIDAVQLHGDVSRQQQHELPAHYQRIYVQSIDAAENLFKNGNPERDYLLFDNAIPGQGIAFDWSQLHYKGAYRFGLAGGLTPENVAIAIKTCQPAWVDVSSGVENPEGEKNMALIKQFIGACHDTDKIRR